MGDTNDRVVLAQFVCDVCSMLAVGAFLRAYGKGRTHRYLFCLKRDNVT